MEDTRGCSAHSAQSGILKVEDFVRNCHALLLELEEFQAFLVHRKREQTVELRQFRNSIQSELKSLEKLSTADPTADRTIHTLRSSNLPYYSAVWTTAKRSTGLLAFNKRFYWELHPSSKSKRNGLLRRRSALVDIVTQNGEEWIKISTVTETRLLFEKAKAGWEDADSSSESDSEALGEGGQSDHADGHGENNDERDGVGLVKLAEDLKKASMAVRIRYRHPKVRFVLPKIQEGTTSEIDEILDCIRRTGAIVQCRNDLEPFDTTQLDNAKTEETEANPSTTLPMTNGFAIPKALRTIFQNLLVDPTASLTPTLNIDCTILLALVSDLSHSPIAVDPRFHRAITRQIELEAKEQLLPSSLWPAMGNRDLVCTVEAANRMREIVDLIGTPAEKARARLLMGNEGMERMELVGAFRQITEHKVPDEWNLPVRVVDKDDGGGQLPAVAQKVAERLTPINRSVFLYGWASGSTTISSNRTVAKLIEHVVEEFRTSEEDRGPDIWLCPTARSLVGKEMGRKD